MGIVVTVAISSRRSPDRSSRSHLAVAHVGAPIKVASQPVAVAVGAGAVWVIDAARETLTKVDPQTRTAVGSPRHVAGGPFAVAVGAGAVWVAAGDGIVRAYDPHTTRLIGSPVTVPGANGLAVGDGGVWVSSRRAATVTRIDVRTRRADPPIRVGRGPADIAIGFGAVWVANADGGSVTRIDPRTRRADTLAVGARQVLAVTVGEGSVWVIGGAGPDGDRTQLVRIDPQGGKVVGKARSVPGAIPLDLVAGNGIWITDSGTELPLRPRRGGVTRVDPATPDNGLRRLRVGRHPSALALGEGGVWVTNETDGTLTPITIAGAR